MRKFDLGIAGAPLGASFFLLDHIKSVEQFWLDVALMVAMFCFIFTSLVAAIQIHRFSRCLGVILSVLAQQETTSGSFKFHTSIKGLNKVELALNCLGYLILVLFLVREIWDIQF